MGSVIMPVDTFLLNYKCVYLASLRLDVNSIIKNLLNKTESRIDLVCFSDVASLLSNCFCVFVKVKSVFRLGFRIVDGIRMLRHVRFVDKIGSEQMVKFIR